MKTNSLSDLALYLGQEAQRLESIIAKYQARAQNSIAPVRNLNNPTIKQMEQNSYYDTIAYFEQLLCQVQFAQERLATGLYGVLYLWVRVTEPQVP